MRCASTWRRSPSCAGSIREADESVSDWELRDLWDEAQSSSTRCGSSAISCSRRSSRGEAEGARGEAERVCERGRERRGRALPRLARGVAARRPPLAPFHWEIEFPEVFERENPGFDAIVGNPPFLGGTRISDATRADTSTGCKHLFARATASRPRRLLLPPCLRLTARRRGLRSHRDQHDRARATRERRACGGSASTAARSILRASAIQVAGRGCGCRQCRPRDEGALRRHLIARRPRRATITAFLFHRGRDDEPEPSRSANARACFRAATLGMGFLFDDLTRMRRRSP